MLSSSHILVMSYFFLMQTQSIKISIEQFTYSSYVILLSYADTKHRNRYDVLSSSHIPIMSYFISFADTLQRNEYDV